MKKNKHLSFDRNFNLQNITAPKKTITKNRNFDLAKNLNLGYYLVTPIIFGVFLGLYLDNLLKTKKLFFIIFFSIGIACTFYNLYKIYKDD